MSFSPLLLKPTIIGMRNRWRSSELTPQNNLRDRIVIAFGILVMLGIFFGTHWTILQAQTTPTLGTIPPSLPFSLVGLMLLFTVTISAVASAMGGFYLSEDLDLILAAPIRPLQFYTGRLAQVFIATTWMPLIFLLPFLAGFGVAYHAPIEYYLVAPLILIPFFLAPVCMSVIIATLIFRFIATIRPRITRAFLLLGFFSLLALFLNILKRSLSSVDSTGEIMRLLAVLSLPNTLWLPSRWLASCFHSLLRPGEAVALPELCLICSLAVILLAASYLIIDVFHFAAFSQARNQRTMQIRHKSNAWVQRLGERCFGSQVWAIVAKEYRLLTRDITHLLELAMLCGLCILYVYNLRTFHVLDSIPPDQRIWWQGCLFVINVGMVAFFATAMCTRFVYPSLSREGRAFWILQTSPIDLRKIMAIKFWLWFCPVGLLASIFFIASGSALHISAGRLIIAGFITWVLCYGIVGAALGFGAIFAYFTWEHPSQLAASFGSFIFMLFATMLIMFTLLPSWFIMFPIPIKFQGHHSIWGTRIVTFLLLMLALLINRIACSIIYDRGEKALLSNEWL
jgi:ABC-2 type transport system permease protein